MDTLHLVPVLVLSIVFVWLLWPVIVEPMSRRLRALRRPEAASADEIAEDLFGVWSEIGGDRAGFDPMRKT